MKLFNYGIEYSRLNQGQFWFESNSGGKTKSKAAKGLLEDYCTVKRRL